jgi:hypothetical protein
MPALSSNRDRGLIYLSANQWKLRIATLVCAIPIAGCVRIVGLGPSVWPASAGAWIFPALMIALATLLPALLFAVHGRYVTRIVLESDGRLSVTTFLVWGERTEKLRAENIAVRRFWLDRTGDAPLGFETLGVLGFRHPCSRGR